MKQTAVEYFNDALDDILELYPSEWIEIQKIFEQAKAMEKEQIELAHIDGGKNKRTAVEYYNKTFKSE